MCSTVKRRKSYKIPLSNSEFIKHMKRFSKFSRFNFWAPKRTKFSKESQMTSDKRDLLKDEHTYAKDQKPSNIMNTCKKTMITIECCFKKCIQLGFNTHLTTSSKWKCWRDSSNTRYSANSSKCLKHGGSWCHPSGRSTLMSARRLVISQVRNMWYSKIRCQIKGKLRLLRAQSLLLWERIILSSISYKALIFFNTPMMVKMVDHQLHRSLERMLNHLEKILIINTSFLGTIKETAKIM